MAKYEITYDWSGDYSDEKNLTEIFEGTYDELKEELKSMKKSGCFNISVAEIDGEE